MTTTRRILSLPLELLQLVLGLVVLVPIYLFKRVFRAFEKGVVLHAYYPVVQLKRRARGEPLWQPQDLSLAGYGVEPPKTYITGQLQREIDTASDAEMAEIESGRALWVAAIRDPDTVAAVEKVAIDDGVLANPHLRTAAQNWLYLRKGTLMIDEMITREKNAS